MSKNTTPPTAPLIFLHQQKKQYARLIAIPCCNEKENLPEVLKSLNRNQPKLLDETLIVINVNNRASSPNLENRQTIQWLNEETHEKLNIAYLDSTSSPFAYPEKFGVGLARAQAIAVALEFIDNKALVISLDGDSPVNPDYLKAIVNFQKNNPSFSAGHVNFIHQQSGTPEEIHAIKLYDAHLHLHRQNLEKAGSPHAWYAIGSTIVCSKEAYLKAGGYNPKRMAGEDFYLIQQLSKVGYKIAMIHDAIVYPSNRQSDRVPFGTGKAVKEIVKDGFWQTYHPSCYQILSQFLQVIYCNLNESGEELFTRSPELIKPWLKEREFLTIWQKLQQNNKTPEKLKMSFDSWLDAFQTLKLIHFLSENHFPRVNIEL